MYCHETRDEELRNKNGGETNGVSLNWRTMAENKQDHRGLKQEHRSMGRHKQHKG